MSKKQKQRQREKKRKQNERRSEREREREWREFVQSKWKDEYAAAEKWSKELQRKVDVRPLKEWRLSEIQELLDWVRSQEVDLVQWGCFLDEQPTVYSRWRYCAVRELESRRASFGVIDNVLLTHIVKNDQALLESVEDCWEQGPRIQKNWDRIEHADIPAEVMEMFTAGVALRQKYPRLQDLLAEVPLFEDMLAAKMKAMPHTDTKELYKQCLIDPETNQKQYAFFKMVYGEKHAADLMMSFWDYVRCFQ